MNRESLLLTSMLLAWVAIFVAIGFVLAGIPFWAAASLGVAAPFAVTAAVIGYLNRRKV